MPPNHRTAFFDDGATELRAVESIPSPRKKRQRTGALQDASRRSGVPGKRASVLDCGGPPPLSASDNANLTPCLRRDVATKLRAIEMDFFHRCVSCRLRGH